MDPLWVLGGGPITQLTKYTSVCSGERKINSAYIDPSSSDRTQFSMLESYIVPS